MGAKTFEFDKIGISNRWAMDCAFSLAGCPTKFLPDLHAMRLLNDQVEPLQFGFEKFDKSLSGVGLAIFRLNMSKTPDYFRHIGPLGLGAVKCRPSGLQNDNEDTGIDASEGVISVDLRN